MTLKPRDDKEMERKALRAKEWKKRRLKKALEMAKEMKDRDMETQAALGKEPKLEGTSIGKLASYLLKKKSYEIDVQVALDIEREKEQKSKEAKKQKPKPAKERRSPIEGEKLKSIGSKFLKYLDGKKDTSVAKDSTGENTSSTKHPMDKPESSFKQVMDDARRVSKDKRHRTTNPSDSEKETDFDKRGKRRKIKMLAPKIHGPKFKSYDEFKAKVHQDYPGLAKNPQFKQWMKDARDYWKIWEIKQQNPTIIPEGLRQKAREMGVKRTKADGVIHQEKIPTIYVNIEKAMTKQEGLERVRALKESLNGASSFDEMRRKLGTFYLSSELKQLPGDEMHEKYSKLFYKMIDALSDGGLHTDIAREAGIRGRNVGSWINGDLPRHPRIASEIPNEPPKDGHKWLPLRLEGKSFTDWIQVPEKIERYEDVKGVLDQLQSLENKQMNDWETRFGKLSKDEAFGYSLGAICSDGGFYRHSMIERFNISLGKKYDWSEAFGEGVCHSLGKLGIASNRISDSSSDYVWENEERTSECMIWISENSPLLNWMKRSVLGFALNGSRSKIDADWLKSSPDVVRRSYIQGVADGDGWVSSMRTGISSNSESKIYSEILETLGIVSSASAQRVVIMRRDDIQRAAELPLFRYAYGRQDKLDTLSKMYESSPKAGFMSDDEKQIIREMSNKGSGPSDIRMEIWG
ncbi:MAG: hypothetical protein ACTSWQ_07700, partial [Candidatus Thorarchaeota archaeon]